jgi:predicted phosphate transport protein (TIGR00153 family)
VALIGHDARVRLRLIPQRREFFDYFCRASSNAVDVARLAKELFDRFPEGGAELIGRIKEHEHTGDDLTHEVVTLINKTFVTPFDRDDIYRLAGAIDDVVDYMDETADNLGSWGVEDVPDEARAMADVILRQTILLDEAVQGLEGFKGPREGLIELRSLEDEGDRLYRNGVGALFRSGADPLTVIRWKDIYEDLEEAIDACENAADVLEAIVVKNR